MIEQCGIVSGPMVRQTVLWRKISRGRFLRVNAELAYTTLLPYKARRR
jgi:hypothetical protein